MEIITENHLPSNRIKEKIDEALLKDPELDVDLFFTALLLSELDKIYHELYDLREHVSRQEYLNHKKNK